MAEFKIYDIRTEYMENPLGLDCEKPRFSWKMKCLEADFKGFKQELYRIRVGSQRGQADMWDSGIVKSDNSIGVPYEGESLKPCTKYYVEITVWDFDGSFADDNSAWFETGFMNPDISAWNGAKWIGAPEKYFTTSTIGVFVIESEIRIHEGGRRAGIVFGANDARLMDARKNQYEIEGENYIKYVIDVEPNHANLVIYRVGYAPGDRADVPFAVVPIVGYETKEPVITDANKYDAHRLKIEVTGNCASAYVDDVLVDLVRKKAFWGESDEPRQLNPLDFNDTTTFPRLCDVGYFVEEGDTASFDGIKVSNLRAPKAVIFHKDEKGITLSGVQTASNESSHSLPMFRREFAVAEGKEIESARLYITARGIYDCRINGEEITDTLLNPGMSQYDKHIMYQTYDIAPVLKSGTNGIGVTLGSGWWCDSQTFTLRNYNYFGDKESFLANLIIKYADGSSECIVSDTDSWDYYGEGPYTYAGLFQGEHLDGRMLSVYEDFSKPGTIILHTKKPVEVIPCAIDSFSTMPAGFGRVWPGVDYSSTKIVGGINAPVAKVCTLTAKSMTEPRKGLFIYDLEQEIAGVPVIRLRGKAGTVVTIRYGEMLYPELPEYGNLHGLMLTENYRDAESIDKYILRGDEDGEIYSPKFTFHGYRYIEISGVDEAPELSDVQSVQISSVKKITGELETSDKLLNRFIENVKWSQLCNFISIPTDCPQRNERMGWAGDTHVFCKTATYQSDTRLFYYRYLQALKDLQEESGQMPNIAPVGGGFGGITYESAMIFMVWELYQQYADIKVIEDYYDCMQKWMEFIKGAGMPGPAFVGPLGDWLAPEETDNNLLWNAFYGRDALLMSRMAAVIGKAEDAECYKELYELTKKYWNETFVDAATGMTKDINGNINDTQCAYALPLAYEMFDDDHKDKAYKHLERKTEEVGYTVSTGFFGTGVLNPMLTEGGYPESAYKLITQTAYPSWLYPVTQGATTIWERWNSYTHENGFGGNNSMNSFNHYSLGSVLSWIYETVLGIRRDENKPGYAHFTLSPQMMVLDYAKGGFETGFGRIESRWEKTETGYAYECTVPENTTATLVLPDSKGGLSTQELGSGAYSFEVVG